MLLKHLGQRCSTCLLKGRRYTSILNQNFRPFCQGEVFLYSSAHDLSRVRSEGACGRFPAGPGRIKASLLSRFRVSEILTFKTSLSAKLFMTENGFYLNESKNHFLLVIYSRLSLNGHLYKTDTSVKWTARVRPYPSLVPITDSP